MIWPAWRLDLKRRVGFKFDEIGVDIIGGKISEEPLGSEVGQSCCNGAWVA